MKHRTLALALVTLGSIHAADLIVAGASDLSPLTSPLSQAFERNMHVPVKFTLGSSGQLTQQIESGAPFDVFLSADEHYVKQLVANGHLEPATVVYALGQIGLWSRDGAVRSFDDLLKPSVVHLAIPNPEHAPYGIAAKKALETRGVWSKIESKIVYGENVRQAMQFAESGNADAVITSWTLLVGRDAVLLPADWHDPIRQSGGVVKSSAQAATARIFLDFLKSAEGQKILQSGGLFAPK